MNKIIALLVFSAFASASANSGVAWLKNTQSASGALGSWSPYTSSALQAFYLNDSNSANFSLASSYLTGELLNYPYWYEADAPGEALWALSNSQVSLSQENILLVKNALMDYSGSHGGFTGFYDFNGTDYVQVESAADTGWALLGLLSANDSNDSITANAGGFLFSLQNSDGSINLTTVSRENTFSAIGLDDYSTTALSLLAWKKAGFTESDSRVSNALNYLLNASDNCFTNSSRVFGPSLSVLAFLEFDRTEAANEVASYLLDQQNSSNGGFVDALRSSYPAPNALDTGIATLALLKTNATTGNYSCSPSQPSPSPSATPTPTVTPTSPPNPGSGNSQIIVKIDFPDSSSKSDKSVQILESCGLAHQCFSQIASLGCQFFSGPAFVCANAPQVTQACLVNSVDGVIADFNDHEANWLFVVNGAEASSGVSCYDPQPNDVIELRFVNGMVGPTPTPTTSAASNNFVSTSLPTPTPNTLKPSVSVKPLVNNIPTASIRATQKPTLTATVSLTPTATEVANQQLASSSITGLFTASNAPIGLGVLILAGLIIFLVKKR